MHLDRQSFAAPHRAGSDSVVHGLGRLTAQKAQPVQIV